MTLHDGMLVKSERSSAFASDNCSSVHPAVVESILRWNEGEGSASYGLDAVSERARDCLRAHFSGGTAAFVSSGTAANVMCLALLTSRRDAVLCTDKAHILRDECGAVERIVGCQLISLPSPDGKLRTSSLKRVAERQRTVHRTVPRIVSISQPTEFGTVYTLDELEEIADLASNFDLRLHIDGARLANAAVSLGVSLGEAACSTSVSAIAFGLSKNGGMLTDVVVCFSDDAESITVTQKQLLQLTAKSRFAAAQVLGVMDSDVWKHNAEHANAMAAYLANEIEKSPGVRIVQPVETNMVFAYLPSRVAARLQSEYDFEVSQGGRIARFVCSWNIPARAVEELSQRIRRFSCA